MLPIRPLLRCLGTAGLLATLAACSSDEAPQVAVEDAGIRLVDGGLAAPDAGLSADSLSERVTIAEFRGTVDPNAGTMSIETLKGADVQSESVRRIQQGLCALNIVQDGVPGSGPADSVELVTDSTALDGACATGAFGPVFCGTVTIRSFYTAAKNNVVAQITTLVPSTGYAVTNSDSIAGVPSGLGVWDYGNLAAAPGPGNSATREWDFARGGASFTFQGRVTVNITELCNGVDDDCDGLTDEGGGCIAAGGACTANSDCATGNSCYSGSCRALAGQEGACATAADCTSGLDCENNMCLAPGSFGHSCITNADCTSPLGCFGDYCTVVGDSGYPCTTNADCNAGLSCYATACRALETDGGNCAVDADCVAGLTCYANACRTIRAPSAAGDVAFSEIMPSSQAGTGDLGEWFEIYNPSTTDYLELSGCVLKDNTTGYAGHTIASANGTTLVAPGDALVFAQSGVAAENHGLPFDYVYSEPAPATLTMLLSNSGDSLSITCGSTLIDAFTYTSSTISIVAGRSVQLDSGLLNGTANDTASNWCSTSGINTYGGVGKIGTPGTSNGSCFSSYSVGRCRLQSPTTITQVAGSTASIYGRLSIPGLTDQTASNDTAAYVRGEIGYGADGSDPTAWTTWLNAGPSAGWTGTETGFDEYRATLTLPSTAGAYDYAVRFTGDNGTSWTYCDLATGAGSDGSEDGYQAANAGAMTVNPLPTPPAVGDIVITEIMVNSQAGTDDGEWFEIYNTSTTTTFDLAGCQVGDNTTLHTIGSTLEIAPQSYKVLGRSNNLTTTHGAVIDYVYGTVFGFNNSGGDNAVLKCSGTIIDSLQSAADAAAAPVVQGYPSAWGGTTYSGASFQLDPALYTAGDNDGETSWCNSRTIFGSNNKKGTPGAANNNCAVPVTFCRLQAPTSITNYVAGTTVVTGRYRSDGLTNVNAAANDISLWTKAQVGYGADGSDPATWTNWTDAVADTTYAGAEPLFDQYKATLVSPAAGAYDYAFRFSGNNGAAWTFCDTDGAATNADYSAAAAGTLTTSIAPSVPVAGEVLFTEVMVASSGNATDDAEWMELYNPSTTTSFELQGCTISNGTTNHVITSTVVVAPGGYALLGRSTDTAVTLGAAVNYSYGSAFQLINGGGNLKLTCAATVVDELKASAEANGYPSDWGSAANYGRSFQVDPAFRTASANDDDANWCNGQGSFGTGVYGTPGAANVNCAINIGWCRLQAPSTLNGFAGGTGFVYGRFYSAGFTDAAATNGTATWLRAEAIVGASGSTPDNTWTSVTASSNTAYTTGAPSFEANNDEWLANLVYPATIGNYGYAFRFSGDKGATWTNCDLNAGTGADGSEGGFQAANAGALSVVPIPAAPAAGEVIITEVMAGAGSATDETEWVELKNTTGASIDLAGCTISDGTSVHSIASALTIAANGYAVLGRSTDTAVNGGVTVNYAYGTAFEIASGDNVVLACGGTTIDELAGFDAAWTATAYAGASFQLDTAAGVNTAAANDTDANWCNSRTSFGSAGKFGTPGAANAACATPVTYCKLQFPTTLSGYATESAGTVYGRAFAAGVTDASTGLNPSSWLRAELAYGADGSNPATWTGWAAATGNSGFTGSGADLNNDEYQAALTFPAAGNYDYAFRFSGDNGATWLYCDTDGAITNADYASANAGAMTVSAAPAAPSVAGAIIISEFMSNSNGSDSTGGEWVELYNTTGATLNLNGCAFWDNANTTATTPPSNAVTINTNLYVPAGGYVVLGGSTTASANKGSGASFAWPLSAPAGSPQVALAQGGDTFTLLCGGTVITSLAFQASTYGTGSVGQSWQLSSDRLNGSTALTINNFCKNTTDIYGGANNTTSNKGTPGAANNACFQCRLETASITGERGATGTANMTFAINGVTDAAGNQTGTSVEFGVGTDGSNPTVSTSGWNFVAGSGTPAYAATGRDSYDATLTIPTYSANGADVAARISRDAGASWTYCDRNVGAGADGSENGYQPANAGAINATADYTVSDCYVQFPTSLSTLFGDVNTVYGRVNIPGVTGSGGAAPSASTVKVQFGYGRDASSPSAWTWGAATENTSTFTSTTLDEFQASYTSVAPAGSEYYGFRVAGDWSSVSGDAGATWTYCDVGALPYAAANAATNTISAPASSFTIGYCANLTSTVAATLGDAAKSIYGEIFISGQTNGAGQFVNSAVKVQYGSGATGSNASTWTNWVDASYDSDNGNNDKYKATVATPTATGSFDYAFRASGDNGSSWTYCMTGSTFSATYDTTKAGVFTTSGETIDWCNTQFPTSLNSSTSSSNTIFGQVYLAGKTNTQATQYTGNGNPAHQSGNIRMQFGYGADGSAPSGWATWANADFNGGSAANNNDEYQYAWTTPATVGRYDYQFRASGDGGVTWTYCDTDGSTTGTGVNAPGDNINTSGTSYSIGWCNIQSPSSITASTGSSSSIYGQLYVAGQTEAAGQASSANLVFQFGYGASATTPSTWTNWSSTTFNVQSGNNDEYVKSWTIPADAVGSKYAFRASGNGGVTWSYCGTGVGATNPNDGTGSAGWGATTITAPSCSNQTNGSQVVISQVYGGGGNSGSVYKNDFIELYNRGNTAVNLNGWSVQQTSAAGTAWQVTALGNVTIAAGGYLLVQQAAGTGGTTNLPTPDVTGTIAMGAASGKVILVSSTTAATIACPSGATVRDLVSYGTGASLCETSLAPAPSAANAIKRTESCTAPSFGDTNVNGTDFTAVTAAPRNSAATANSCSCTGP